MSAAAPSPSRSPLPEQRPRRPKRRTGARARRRVRGGTVVRGVVGLAWVLARLAVIAACVGVIVAWRAFDVTPLAIVSGSMEPTIPTNALIFVEEVDPSKVRVGDVITFDPPGATPRVTHRVIKRELIAREWYFETKGDANAVADDWRSEARRAAGDQTQSRGITYGPNQALRYVWGVPWAGHVLKITERPALRMALVFGSLGGIALLVLWRIWRPEPTTAASPKVERSRKAPAA